jgi:acyl-CoA reductase-like NAD-dependent aldehyde dehydrogenase
MTPHQRTRVLLKIASLIEKHADELAELETLDNGKPLSQARSVDINGVAGIFRYFAGWPTKIYGETNPSDPSFSTILYGNQSACAASSCRGISR